MNARAVPSVRLHQQSTWPRPCRAPHRGLRSNPLTITQQVVTQHVVQTGSRFAKAVQLAWSELTTGTMTIASVAFLIGCVLGLIAGRYRPIRTALDITNDDLDKHRVFTGKVVAVSDGDTLRIRHRPWWACFMPMPKNVHKAEQSVAVRVAAVDCPEVAHFGKKGQPFGLDAKKFTTERILGKCVRMRALVRDQYGRLVASITYGPWFARRSLAKELIQNGLAVVYRQTGAEEGWEGKGKEYDQLEKQAKEQNKGLWSQGDDLVTPSEYKKED